MGLIHANNYEVMDENNIAISLQKWKVCDLPCKHACATICKHTPCYVDDYFSIDWYRSTYAEPIYPIPDRDKPRDGLHELRITPPITKKKPDHPQRNRIESQSFDVYDSHCNWCHEVTHDHIHVMQS